MEHTNRLREELARAERAWIPIEGSGPQHEEAAARAVAALLHEHP